MTIPPLHDFSFSELFIVVFLSVCGFFVCSYCLLLIIDYFFGLLGGDE